jgi:hypothetical protein
MLLLVIEAFKSWAFTTELGYKNFLNLNTSMFCLMDSVIDAYLMEDIFVADFTCCYESIPL